MNEPLPDLHLATLDVETLAQLFADLETHAELLEVRVKDGPRAHSPDVDVPFAEARHRLETGDVRSIQLRYRHHGAEWLDTLRFTTKGVDLVRMRHEV